MNDQGASVESADADESEASSGSRHVNGSARSDSGRAPGSFYVRLGDWDARTESWSFDLVAASGVVLTALHVDGGVAPRAAWVAEVEQRRIRWQGPAPEEPDRAYVSVALAAPGIGPVAAKRWWERKDFMTIAGLGLAIVPAVITAYYSSGRTELIGDQLEVSRNETKQAQEESKRNEATSALCKSSLGQVVKLCTAAGEPQP